MRVREEPDNIILTIQAYWSFRSRWLPLLAVLGSVVFGGHFVFDLVVNRAGLDTTLARVAGVLVAAVFGVLALWTVQEWRGRTLDVDRRRRLITVAVPRLLGTARREIPFADIADIAVIKQPPSWRTFGGDTSFQLRAQLFSNEVVPLSHFAPAMERDELEDAAARIKRALQ